MAKEWKTADGRSVHGNFVSSDETTLIVETPEGDQVPLRRDQLVPEDARFLAVLEEYREDIGLPRWPASVRNQDPIRLKGGPTTYRTRHFQITAGDVEPGELTRLATVMEDTLAAISGIPTGLDLKPPAPAAFYRVRIMDRPSFDRAFAEVGMSLTVPSEKVRGAYIAGKRELWLPVDFGEARLASLVPTVIHEVCHQTMHDWLPLLPVWFLEGFAEYMAAIPYAERTFHFDRALAGLKETLQTRYRTPLGDIAIDHPARMLSPKASWDNEIEDYIAAMLLVYYLIHLDGGGSGESFVRTIREIASVREEADELMSDIQEIADQYNSRVARYREQIIAYREALDKAQSELRSGRRAFIRSAGDGRVVIAGTPALPEPPAAPGIAPIEEISREREKTINLISTVQRKAVLALLGGRNVEEFAAQMRAAYRRQGIGIEYR